MAITDEEQDKGLPIGVAPVDADMSTVGGLIRRIAGNAKALASDQVDLAKAELTRRIKAAVIDAAMFILGGMIVLFAIGFLGGALVTGLEPVIASLPLRFIVTALVFAGVSGGLLVVYGKRLKAHLPPEAPAAVREVEETVEAVKEELHHA
jgi:hypothetical protein